MQLLTGQTEQLVQAQEERVTREQYLQEDQVMLGPHQRLLLQELPVEIAREIRLIQDHLQERKLLQGLQAEQDQAQDQHLRDLQDQRDPQGLAQQEVSVLLQVQEVHLL